MTKKAQQTTQVIIGIDVAKSKLDIYILPGEEYLVIANNEKSIRQFIKDIKRRYIVQMIVMESTGGYERVARQLFNEKMLPVHIAHPNRMFHFAKQKGIFAKTDKLDAKTAALYGRDEKVQCTPIFDKTQEELKALTYRRSQLVEQISAEKKRVDHTLPLSVKRSMLRVIKQLESEKETISTNIVKLINNNPKQKEAVKRLKTFSGVGDIIAYSLVSLVPELGSLKRNQIAALIGLAPKNKESGTKKGVPHINGGRFYARKLLYMGALVAIKHNKTMKTIYEKLIARGKHAKVAIVTVMRKIIITLNAMLRDSVDWIENFKELRPVYPQVHRAGELPCTESSVDPVGKLAKKEFA